jgi:hypothetical protein
MKNSGDMVWSTSLSNNPKYFILDSKENLMRMRCRLIFDPNGHSNTYSNKENNMNDELSLIQSFNVKIKGGEEDSTIHDQDDEEDDDDDTQDDDEEMEKKKKITEEEWVGVSWKASNREKYKKDFNEETICVIDGELIKPMNIIQGKFEITSNNIYFFSLSEQETEIKISLQDMVEIYKRRYLLRHTV